MKYLPTKRELILNRELSNLDNFVIDFIKVLKKHSDYCIISGYISILLGRARATEDIDLFMPFISEQKFSNLYQDLEENGYWCLNTDNFEQAYDYLNSGLAIRFAKNKTAIPNFEIKFPKKKIDKETFLDFIIVKLAEEELKISSLERQIAFKELYLGSQKDMEDAEHIRQVFKEKLDIQKINKLKELIKKDEEKIS